MTTHSILRIPSRTTTLPPPHIFLLLLLWSHPLSADTTTLGTTGGGIHIGGDGGDGGIFPFIFFPAIPKKTTANTAKYSEIQRKTAVRCGSAVAFFGRGGKKMKAFFPPIDTIRQKWPPPPPLTPYPLPR